MAARPVKYLFKAQLQAELTQNPDKMRTIVCKMLDMAAAGDLGAMREVIDRVDGKAKQEIENTHSILSEMSDDMVKARLSALEDQMLQRAKAELTSTPEDPTHATLN